MIQIHSLQRARLPILGLAALGLVAFGGISLGRVGIGSASVATSASTAMVQTSAIVQPAVVTAVPASDNTCGKGVYVSGDMVGDASPAAVLAAMCGSSR